MLLQTAVVVVVGTIMVHWYLLVFKKQQNPRVILQILVEVRNIPCASGRNTG